MPPDVAPPAVVDDCRLFNDCSAPHLRRQRRGQDGVEGGGDALAEIDVVKQVAYALAFLLEDWIGVERSSQKAFPAGFALRVLEKGQVEAPAEQVVALREKRALPPVCAKVIQSIGGEHGGGFQRVFGEPPLILDVFEVVPP